MPRTQIFYGHTPSAYTSLSGFLSAGARGRNSQAQSYGWGQLCRRLCSQRLELRCRVFKDRADGLSAVGHNHLAPMVQGWRAHIVLVTIDPNVVQIDSRRPLHVRAEQHHANQEALIGNATLVHVSNGIFGGGVTQSTTKQMLDRCPWSQEMSG